LFGFLCVIAAVQFLAEVRFVADAALLIGLYTVAAHESRRRAVTAAAVLEVGVVLASVRFAPTGSGVIASIVFLSGLVAAALFSGVTLQTRRDLLASLLDRAQQLERERDQQIRLAATAERTRIAREMHDVIAHSLSVIITLADGAALSNSTAPAEATEAMLQVAATGRTSMAEMRRLLGVLRESGTTPDLGPQPGLDRLDALIAEMRAAGLPARLSVTGASRPVPPTTASVVYRIVQESLTNALKHADHPTHVWVTIHWHAEHVSLTISDDGGPGSAATPQGLPSTGHGVTGMRERAALFGAALTAGPRAPRGWQVRTTLPLEPFSTALPLESGT
jgi:signal transduction histidine kinase